MKNFLVLSLAMVAVSGIAGATAACGSTNYSATALTTLGSCEVGNEVFSGFSLVGSDSNLAVTFAGSGLGPYNVTVSDSTNAALTANFTFAYTVTTDETGVVGGFDYISNIGAGGVDSFNSVAANNNTFTNAGSCSSLNSPDSGSGGFTTHTCGTSGQPQGIGVSEAYVYTSGFTATAIQDTYLETFQNTSGVPEPGSMMLLGSGLLAAGLIGRKKLAARK